MTNAQRNTLAAQVSHSLGGFNRYMNRPIARAQVFTWRLANDLQENCPCIRLLPAYRDSANKTFRTKLARCIRTFRKSFRITLPVYDESKGEYVHAEQHYPKEA